jgi:maltose 6'-phosphate phosphatase
MNPEIQFVSVRNVIARTVEGTSQRLVFTLCIRAGGMGKRVWVHWAGEDGAWQSSEAFFREPLGNDGAEWWTAEVRVPLGAEKPLPGNIRFAGCVVKGDGSVSWDSRFGANYESDADSGVIGYGNAGICVSGPEEGLREGALSVPLEIAVRQDLRAEAVRVHWSTDGWATQHVAAGYFRVDHWDRTVGSNARNPNRYGWGVWAARLPVRDAYRLEYAVECRLAGGGTVWENGGGNNHLARRRTLRVMTLNLHTWQEEDQLRKFETIARAIAEQRIDIACLQEVGENWNGGAGDWASNAARIINSHLPEPYHLHTDFSHIGFDRYKEGVAILSRWPFVLTDSGYVSDSQDVHDIHSRRVVMATVRVPSMGPVNVFSAHLSWPENGFREQYDRVLGWARARQGEETVGTFVCGDFNVAVGSDSFKHVVDAGGFEDQFLKITQPENFQRVFRRKDADPRQLLAHEGRIDYIWLSTGSRLRAISAEELFTPGCYGRVSDHTGYRVEFELR